MSQVSRSVGEAIERWQQKALISAELAGRLRDEAAEADVAGTARMSQYLLASAGAVVLLIAAGVFLDWAWPRMDDPMRTGFLLVVGVAVHLWGARLEAARRWLPAALLMQTAGLALLMVALIYSEEAWADVTAGGVASGIAALAVPILLAPRSLRANAVMPAVHLCFALGFVAVFLDRATTLSGNDVVWVLDGILVAASAAMVAVLRRDPAGSRHPWALNAFVAAVYAAAVLIVLTATGPMGLEDEAVYGLDVWLFLVAGLALWGIHRSPEGLRRSWFEDQVAYCILLWVPLGFMTVMEAMEAPSELGLALVGGASAAGFAYAVRRRIRRILVTSALAFVAATWIWASDRGGALAAVVGLTVAAAVLFRVSGRVGKWASGVEGEEG